MNISPGSLSSALGAVITPSTQPSAGSGFAEVIGAAIGQVEAAQSSAKAATANLLTGGQGDIHTVALAAQKASLSLELFQQVRNKFVSAYQEVMRMPM
jgi:flagellar hook-basal body complex protein FliE